MATARKPRAKAAPQPRAAAVSPLLDPTAVLAGQPLQRAASQVTDLQYRPQLHALDTQASNTRTQFGAVGAKANDYYKGLAAEEAKAVARQQALGDWLKTSQAGVGAATQGAFQGMTDAEHQRQQQDASVRGAGLGGGRDVAGTIVATQGRAATLQQGAANAGVEAAGGWAGLLNAISAAHALRGTEQQGQISNRELNTLGSIADKRASLEGERGNALTKNLLDLRQQGFTNLATTQGLNLDQSKLAATVQDSIRSNQTAQQRIDSANANNAADRTSREGIATANRTAANDRAAAGRTAAQQKQDAKDAAAEQKRVQGVRTAAGKAWAPFETAQGLINSGGRVNVQSNGTQTYDKAGNPVTRAATTQETIGALRAQKVPEWAIQAAVSIRHHGFITPEVIDLIHRSAPDVRIPTQYRKPTGGKLARRPGYQH